jgi:threonine dehydratase
MPTDYLERILAARVYDVAIETPLDHAPALSARIGNRVLLKREDLQPVFSFKLRGAYNKIVHLPKEKLKRGVICASAGNHAQGVALAAAKVGCRAVIVMPTTTPQIKVQAVQAAGGEVVLAGDSYDDAYAHALELEKREKLSFVHPFDDPEVIAGQGTIGMEILRQHAQPIHAVFCCVGGGGLISGMSPPTSSACGRRPGSSASKRSTPTPWRVRCRRQARPAGPRRPVRRWRGGQVRRRGDLSPLSDVRR